MAPGLIYYFLFPKCDRYNISRNSSTPETNMETKISDSELERRAERYEGFARRAEKVGWENLCQRRLKTAEEELDVELPDVGDAFFIGALGDPASQEFLFWDNEDRFSFAVPCGDCVDDKWLWSSHSGQAVYERLPDESLKYLEGLIESHISSAEQARAEQEAKEGTLTGVVEQIDSSLSEIKHSGWWISAGFTVFIFTLISALLGEGVQVGYGFELSVFAEVGMLLFVLVTALSFGIPDRENNGILSLSGTVGILVGLVFIVMNISTPLNAVKAFILPGEADGSLFIKFFFPGLAASMLALGINKELKERRKGELVKERKWGIALFRPYWERVVLAIMIFPLIWYGSAPFVDGIVDGVYSIRYKLFRMNPERAALIRDDWDAYWEAFDAYMPWMGDHLYAVVTVTAMLVAGLLGWGMLILLSPTRVYRWRTGRAVVGFVAGMAVLGASSAWWREIDNMGAEESLTSGVYLIVAGVWDYGLWVLGVFTIVYLVAGWRFRARLYEEAGMLTPLDHVGVSAGKILNKAFPGD